MGTKVKSDSASALQKVPGMKVLTVAFLAVASLSACGVGIDDPEGQQAAYGSVQQAIVTGPQGDPGGYSPEFSGPSHDVGHNSLPVDPDRRVRHGSFYFQRKLLPFIRGRNRDLLAVPADSRTRQPAHASAASGLERPLDRPIVRQIQLLPAAIVEPGLHVRQVASRVKIRS